jgi:hypothetical protein
MIATILWTHLIFLLPHVTLLFDALYLALKVLGFDVDLP